MKDIPAFPQSVAVTTGESPISSSEFVDGGGMTMRDYFAAKAMQALIRNYTADEDFKAFSKQSDDKGIGVPELIAGMAYENADAMLIERSKPPTP